MRVFIAVPLPVDFKAKLAALQLQLRGLPVEAVWVRETGFHITLKFLGEIDSNQIGPIISCMVETGRCFHPFSLTLHGVEVFPRESSPRVLWVGIQDERGLLRQIQQSLEAGLALLGYRPEDRPFVPHLTLARLKRVSHRSEFLAGLRAHHEAVIGQFGVDHIELIESHLHPSGAYYSTVRAVHFPQASNNSKLNE